jgi:hypothetical protein
VHQRNKIAIRAILDHVAVGTNLAGQPPKPRMHLEAQHDHARPGGQRPDRLQLAARVALVEFEYESSAVERRASRLE